MGCILPTLQRPSFFVKGVLLVYYIYFLGLKGREKGKGDKWLRIGQAVTMGGVRY